MDAADLYRLPPEDFTAARDAAAKERKASGDADGAKELKALRRPSVSAWLVNLLAVEESDLLEQLLELGPALAEAQAGGQGDDLRALGAQRRELVGAVTARAVELGGCDVTSSVRDEVSATLETALADPDSAEAVRSGRLVRALSYAGFGGVDLDGAVATAGPGKAASKPKQKQKPEQKPDDTAERIAAAEAAALDGAGRLDDAVRAGEQAQREHARAKEQAQQAHDEAARLREALREAEQQAQAADADVRRRGKAADEAVDAVRRAQDAADGARVELDRLRRG